MLACVLGGLGRFGTSPFHTLSRVSALPSLTRGRGSVLPFAPPVPIYCKVGVSRYVQSFIPSAAPIDALTNREDEATATAMKMRQWRREATTPRLAAALYPQTRRLRRALRQRALGCVCRQRVVGGSGDLRLRRLEVRNSPIAAAAACCSPKWPWATGTPSTAAAVAVIFPLCKTISSVAVTSR